MHRREFLVTTGAAAAVATLGRSALAAPRRATGLRTISYNILACRGYPDTDANRARRAAARERMAERMALELGLYAPDIVTFQESPSEAMVQAIADGLQMQHARFPGGFPGSVLARGRILETTNCPLVSGERPKDLFTRHWGRAVIEVNGRRIVVYTAHLHPGNAATREREVTAMLAAMQPDLASGVDVVFQGDLNHAPDGPEYARWKAAGLRDAFAEKGTGQPLTIPSTEPRTRIDYVWMHGPLADRLTDCRVLFEGAFRTNPDDPASFALSDHIPVMATCRAE